jgi:hypothetical protein
LSDIERGFNLVSLLEMEERLLAGNKEMVAQDERDRETDSARGESPVEYI